MNNHRSITDFVQDHIDREQDQEAPWDPDQPCYAWDGTSSSHDEPRWWDVDGRFDSDEWHAALPRRQGYLRTTDLDASPQYQISEPSSPQTPYMQQPSRFALDETPPSETAFMDWYPSGNATLTYETDAGVLASIRNIDLKRIEERSVTLAMAFEPSRSGPRLFLNTLTSRTALPFLRYLYTGSYANRHPDSPVTAVYEDVPTSLLLHCHLYRLGDIYDLPELKSQAYVNILRQCEFGCSSADKPIDLCAAVRFVYSCLSSAEGVIDAIVNYCVACFLGHKLADDVEFRELAYELRPFNQALCQNSLNRQFENETAAAIIQLPFKTYKPDTYASREDFGTAALEDVVYRFHCYDKLDGAADEVKKGKGHMPNQKRPADREPVTLPLRQRRKTADTTEVARAIKSADEFDFGFDLGGRNRTRVAFTSAGPSNLMASLKEDDMKPPIEVAEPVREKTDKKSTQEVQSADSDSDISSFVEVKHEDVSEDEQRPWSLPLRTRDHSAAGVGHSEAAESSESDSEWTRL